MSTASVEIEALAALLDRASLGPGSWDAHLYEVALPGLVTLLGRAGLKSEWARYLVASEAAEACAKERPITGRGLKTEYERRAKQYSTRPKHGFVLAAHTNLAVARSHTLRFHHLGTTLTFSPSPLPSRFGRRREELESQPQARLVDFALPQGVGTSVRVHVNAATQQEARELGVRAIQFFRGFLGLLRPRSYSLVVTTRPLADLWFGPVFTLHDHETGLLSSQSVHYDGARPPIDTSVAVDGGFWRALSEWRTWLGKQHPYRLDCKEVIARYGEAIGERDSQTASVNLWSLLENMTGNRPRNDEVVRRVAFLFEDHQECAAILQHLRKRRNEIVHDGARLPLPSAYAVASDLEHFARRLVLFHVRMGRRLGGFKRACEFLDAPPDADLLSSALRFRTNDYSALRSQPAT